MEQLEKVMKDSIPLWNIEDQLTEARQKAQEGDVEACKKQTEKAMLMLEHINEPMEYLKEVED